MLLAGSFEEKNSRNILGAAMQLCSVQYSLFDERAGTGFGITTL